MGYSIFWVSFYSSSVAAITISLSLRQRVHNKENTKSLGAAE
jgi:hypothetical protein